MCTNFLLVVPNDADPALSLLHVSARCLELAGATPTSIFLVPRGQSFPQVDPPPVQPTAPAPAVATWTNSHGFVGVASPKDFATFACFMDGLNDVGLSAAALWMPGTVYPASATQPYLCFSDLVAWMLGQFEFVAEIERALAKISVIGPPIPTAPGPSFYVPIHFIATDRTGHSLVIEFIDGVMKVYPPSYGNGATSDGVLTNAPTYDWQRANLANYAHLDVVSPATSVTNNSGAPVGSGLLGMPGDSMSASRFVKAATLRKGFSRLDKEGHGWLPAPGGEAAQGFAGSVQTIVNVAMQMVQLIQTTPYGTALERDDKTERLQVGDWTMWSLVRDHTNRKLYFTTAFNGIMRAVDVQAALNSVPGGPIAAFPSIPLMPTPSLAWYEDASTWFTTPAQSAS